MIGTDIKGTDGIIECLERGRDILRSLNFECDDLKARRASRCVCLPQLRHGGAITDIGQYRQTAKTDNSLTQKFKSFASRISVLQRQAGCLDEGSRKPTWVHLPASIRISWRL